VSATYDPANIATNIVDWIRARVNDIAELSGTTVGAPICQDEEYLGMAGNPVTREGVASCVRMVARRLSDGAVTANASAGQEVSLGNGDLRVKFGSDASSTKSRDALLLDDANWIFAHGMPGYEAARESIVAGSPPLPASDTDVRLMIGTGLLSDGSGGILQTVGS
jgi:hypothetical protein